MQSDCQRSKAIGPERVVKASGHSPDIRVEVVDAARAHIGDIHQRRAAEDGLPVAGQGKLLLPKVGWDLEQVGAGGALERLRGAARRHRHRARALEQRHHIHRVVHRLPPVGPTHEVVAAAVVRRAVRRRVGRVAVQPLEIPPIPVDQLLILDVGRHVRVAVLVRGNEWLRQVQEAVVRHVVGPFRVSVVIVSTFQGPRVVALTVIVPGDDFDHLEALAQHVLPAVVPQGAAREDPVLTVRYLWAEVGEEPGRDGGEVGLAGEPAAVGVVAVGDCDVLAGLGGLVVAVVVPGLWSVSAHEYLVFALSSSHNAQTYHPVQSPVDGGRRRLPGVEVGHKVHVAAGRIPQRIHVKAVTGKRRCKGTVVDVELCGPRRILGNLLADACRVAGAPPVEVKGDEHLHPGAISGVVGKVELLVRVSVDTNVKGKGVNARGLGSLHIIIIIGTGGAITTYPNLASRVRRVSDY